MFELLSSGPRHPFHDSTMTPQLVSIAGHTCVLTAVVLWPLLVATNRLPSVPGMMAFVATVAPPAVPAPPPPPAPVAKAPVPRTTAPTTGQFVAPSAVPDDIRPERDDDILPGAGEGGIEGGIAGGVAGGIVGGLVAAAPPPPPPPPPAPARDGPVRIGGNIQAPALVRRVEPTYPEMAMVAKVTGIVILEASVNEDGTVSEVRVLRSVKFLDQAAVEAVRQWRYSPLVLNGVHTPFVLSVTLNFSMKDARGTS